MHCVIIGWAVSAAYNSNNTTAAKLLGLNPSAIRLISKQGASSNSNGGNGKHSEVLQILAKVY